MTETEYSTFEFNNENVLKSQTVKHIIIGLKENENLILCGMVSVRLAKGNLSINGFSLNPGMYYNCYFPKWENSMVFEPIFESNEKDPDKIITPFEKEGMIEKSFTDNELFEENIIDQEYVTKLGQKFSIIIILRSIEPNFINIDCIYSISNTKQNNILFGCKIILNKNHFIQNKNNTFNSLIDQIGSFDPVKIIKIPFYWENTIQEILEDCSKKKNNKIFICGGQHVGKSTFGRYLINKLLNKHTIIGYLDLDLGQPEFTCSGIISLHLIIEPLFGPPHTHMKQPYKAFFYGNHSPSNDPARYLQMIQELVNFFQKNSFFLHIPIIINSCGWVRNMGLDLLNDIIRMIEPNHIVQLIGIKKSSHFELNSLSNKMIYHPLHSFECETNVNDDNEQNKSFHSSVFRTAKERRQYRLRCFFLSNTSTNNHPNENIFTSLQLKTLLNGKMENYLSLSSKYNGWLNKQISSIFMNKTPFIIHFSEILIGFTGPHTISPNQILFALNNAIVGLHIDPYKYINKNKTDNINEYIVPKLLIKNSEISYGTFIGLAIVRGINKDKKQLYLLTSTMYPEDLLNYINVLVIGSLEISSELIYFNHFHSSPYWNHYNILQEGTGGKMMQSRNSLKRKKDFSNH